jgi:voltage-gated potassium channel
VPPKVRLHQVERVLAAIVATLLGGTIAFRETLHESWFQSFHRAVVTVTLTGLDTVAAGDGPRIVSLVLVALRLAIIGYAGAVIVEAVAGGVITGALAERRRKRTIEHLHDHFIICGYGRVGRRVSEEFRASPG